MSSNSLNFKGLQNGKSLEALSFLSQSVIFQNRRERERKRKSLARKISYDGDIYKSF